MRSSGGFWLMTTNGKPRTKGRFWRSSIRQTLKTMMEHHWQRGDVRDVVLLPAGTRLLSKVKVGSPPVFPRARLRWEDKVAYGNDPLEGLHAMTNRVCLELMKQGYEVKEGVVSVAENLIPCHVGPPSNGNERQWGIAGDNGGPSDKNEE